MESIHVVGQSRGPEEGKRCAEPLSNSILIAWPNCFEIEGCCTKICQLVGVHYRAMGLSSKETDMRVKMMERPSKKEAVVNGQG